MISGKNSSSEGRAQVFSGNENTQTNIKKTSRDDLRQPDKNRLNISPI